MAELLLVLLAPVYLFGAAMLYAAYRFVRKPEVDETAGFFWFISIVWSLATQTKAFAERFEFVAKDLTEALEIRPDDGRFDLWTPIKSEIGQVLREAPFAVLALCGFGLLGGFILGAAIV